MSPNSPLATWPSTSAVPTWLLDHVLTEYHSGSHALETQDAYIREPDFIEDSNACLQRDIIAESHSFAWMRHCKLKTASVPLKPTLPGHSGPDVHPCFCQRFSSKSQEDRVVMK